MIKSCSECKTPCCRVGPGPYVAKPFPEYYENSAIYKGYNTKCEWFDEETSKCTVWGTKKLPVECKIYVCTSREYSKEELQKIKRITDRLDLRGVNGL